MCKSHLNKNIDNWANVSTQGAGQLVNNLGRNHRSITKRDITTIFLGKFCWLSGSGCVFQGANHWSHLVVQLMQRHRILTELINKCNPHRAKLHPLIKPLNLENNCLVMQNRKLIAGGKSEEGKEGRKDGKEENNSKQSFSSLWEESICFRFFQSLLS